jgi:transcriptional regulator with XRE-family HTH domain
MSMKRFGEFIRARRHALGLSQEAFGFKFEPLMSQSEVSRLESGKMQLPQAMRLRALAEVLQVSPADLRAIRLDSRNEHQ